MTNNRYLDKVAKNMIKLNKIFQENNMFISQRKDNSKEQASVIIGVCDRSDDEAFLAIRRLLTALQYRLSESNNMQLTFELKRKEK